MPDPSRPISNLLAGLTALGQAARDAVVRTVSVGPPAVQLYDGFGATDGAFVVGRVMEDPEIAPAGEGQSTLDNFLGMFRRANAHGVPHAVVRVDVGGASQELACDDEGFFHGIVSAPYALPRIDDEWARVTAEIVKPAAPAVPVRGSGRVLLPAVAPKLMVISDIDDTVLQSKVTNLFVAARTIAFGNARTRLPFPGVAAFYQALRLGRSGAERNPIFYISSSPWNLYDVIKQFLELQQIPDGPLMLRDLDITLDVLSSSRHHLHKGAMIQRVLDAIPDVPVVLIGDSGQQDPEIYRDVVRQHGRRIVAVYIRNVTMNAERSQAIAKLADEVLAAGSSLVLADDTLAAAKHAAEHGLIDPASLASIGVEKKEDERAPGADHPPTPTVVVEK